MIIITFIVLSIFSTILSAIFCKRILNLIKSSEEKYFFNNWGILTLIIYLFLIGLLAYLAVIITASSYNTVRHLLVSSLILSMSLFIFIILNFSFKLIKKLDRMNINLKEKEKRLIKTKILLKEKNVEPEKTMEDFYTFRLQMADDLTQVEKKTIKEENEKLAKKITKLKESKSQEY